MKNIDIASALRQKGWKTALLVDGTLSAVCGNLVITRKADHLKVLIQQKQTIKVDYRPESQPKEIGPFIEWILGEIAALISFSLEIKGREPKKPKKCRKCGGKCE